MLRKWKINVSFSTGRDCHLYVLLISVYCFLCDIYKTKHGAQSNYEKKKIEMALAGLVYKIKIIIIIKISGM